MSKLHKLKRNFLIKLMSMLGFGGMVGFCISSCDSDYNQEGKYNLDPTYPSTTIQIDTDDTSMEMEKISVLKVQQRGKPPNKRHLIPAYGVPYPMDPPPNIIK